jgi:hypothetical protein
MESKPDYYRRRIAARGHTMNRQQWKDLLEIIGFVAIILSLVFVGFESRNSTREAALNTQALEIAAYQGLMTSIDEINLLSLQNAALASTMSEIWDESTGDLETFQRNTALYIVFRHGDLAFSCTSAARSTRLACCQHLPFCQSRPGLAETFGRRVKRPSQKIIKITSIA